MLQHDLLIFAAMDRNNSALAFMAIIAGKEARCQHSSSHFAGSQWPGLLEVRGLTCPSWERPGHTHLDEVVGDVLGLQAVHSLGCCLGYIHPGVVWLQLTEVSKEMSRFFEERCGMTRKHLPIKTRKTRTSLFLCFLPKGDKCSSWPINSCSSS